MEDQQFRPGWDANCVQPVIAHYDAQTDDDEARAIEDAKLQDGMTRMVVPTGLVDKVRALIDHQTGS